MTNTFNPWLHVRLCDLIPPELCDTASITKKMAEEFIHRITEGDGSFYGEINSPVFDYFTNPDSYSRNLKIDLSRISAVFKHPHILKLPEGKGEALFAWARPTGSMESYIRPRVKVSNYLRYFNARQFVAGEQHHRGIVTFDFTENTKINKCDSPLEDWRHVRLIDLDVNTGIQESLYIFKERAEEFIDHVNTVKDGIFFGEYGFPFGKLNKKTDVCDVLELITLLGRPENYRERSAKIDADNMCSIFKYPHIIKRPDGEGESLFSWVRATGPAKNAIQDVIDKSDYRRCYGFRGTTLHRIINGKNVGMIVDIFSFDFTGIIEPEHLKDSQLPLALTFAAPANN